MSTKSIGLSDELQACMLQLSLRETKVMARLRAETALLPRGSMQIAPEQGQLMRLLVEMLDARLALEIGTFTGYSALCVATALPADGRLIACDVSPEWTDIARRYWKEAGVDGRIDLRLAPALETLDQLLSSGHAERFDFIFVDADKENYPQYYEQSLRLLRRGGVVTLDNAFRDGQIVESDPSDPGTRALRELLVAIRDDDRVSTSLVPIADGLLIARKR